MGIALAVTNMTVCHMEASGICHVHQANHTDNAFSRIGVDKLSEWSYSSGRRRVLKVIGDIQLTRPS